MDFFIVIKFDRNSMQSLEKFYSERRNQNSILILSISISYVALFSVRALHNFIN